MRAAALTVVLAAGLVGLVSAQQASPTPPERKLDLTFDGAGNVSLVAQGVTVREILAEWSRKGGSVITGADRLSGGPVSVQFTKESEVTVMSSLLRSAAGLILIPRTAALAGGSRLDVALMATSTGMQASGGSSPIQMNTMPTQGDPNNDIPSVPQQQGQPAPPPQSRPANAPGVVTVPLIAMPPIGTTTPPPNGGRGGGGLR